MKNEQYNMDCKLLRPLRMPREGEQGIRISLKEALAIATRVIDKPGQPLPDQDHESVLNRRRRNARKYKTDYYLRNRKRLVEAQRQRRAAERERRNETSRA